MRSSSPAVSRSVIAQGQAAHQPFFLLEVQPGELAVVLLGDGTGLKHIVGELPLAVCGVEDQESQKEHPLIPALQVLQELFRLCPVGSKVRGK